MNLEELELRERLYALIKQDRSLSPGEREDFVQMLDDEAAALRELRAGFDRFLASLGDAA